MIPDAFNEVFVNDGKIFWSRQREMCRLGRQVPQDRRLLGQHDRQGLLVGRLIWWWLLTRPGSLVMSRGPSQTSLG